MSSKILNLVRFRGSVYKKVGAATGAEAAKLSISSAQASAAEISKAANVIAYAVEQLKKTSAYSEHFSLIADAISLITDENEALVAELSNVLRQTAAPSVPG
jgi:F0F1-type ATP synthase membrane subunit b/b'